MEKKVKPFSILNSVMLILFFCTYTGAGTSLQGNNELSSSQSCKECHVEIFNSWTNAMHSMSFEDPIFKASYLESYFKTMGEAKFKCLRCHTPVVLTNNDYDLKKEITKEGVTCDFCHSIKSVDLNNHENPFELEPGKIKMGPLSNVSSPAHDAQSSSLFKSSELCAGCHEYSNPQGIIVLGTYSEWKASPYAADGIQCQDCHMPLIEGKTVRADIKTPSRKKINLHAISAGHSVEQLKKALKVKIKEINKEKDFVEVVVKVTNTGSGHLVPTGIPSRKLILWAELKTPVHYVTQKRIYQRILEDEQGQAIKDVDDMFEKAVKVTFDTRIKPKETRIEKFVFVLPDYKDVTISIRMEYLYKAKVLNPVEMRVIMAEDEKHLKK